MGVCAVLTCTLSTNCMSDTLHSKMMQNEEDGTKVLNVCVCILAFCLREKWCNTARLYYSQPIKTYNLRNHQSSEDFLPLNHSIHFTAESVQEIKGSKERRRVAGLLFQVHRWGLRSEVSVSPAAKPTCSVSISASFVPNLTPELGEAKEEDTRCVSVRERDSLAIDDTCTPALCFQCHLPSARPCFCSSPQDPGQ